MRVVETFDMLLAPASLYHYMGRYSAFGYSQAVRQAARAHRQPTAVRVSSVGCVLGCESDGSRCAVRWTDSQQG